MSTNWSHGYRCAPHHRRCWNRLHDAFDNRRRGNTTHWCLRHSARGRLRHWLQARRIGHHHLWLFWHIFIAVFLLELLGLGHLGCGPVDHLHQPVDLILEPSFLAPLHQDLKELLRQKVPVTVDAPLEDVAQRSLQLALIPKPQLLLPLLRDMPQDGVNAVHHCLPIESWVLGHQEQAAHHVLDACLGPKGGGNAGCAVHVRGQDLLVRGLGTLQRLVKALEGLVLLLVSGKGKVLTLPILIEGAAVRHSASKKSRSTYHDS